MLPIAELADPKAARDLLMLVWEPDDHPEHCSNCRHARVGGEPERPVVRCPHCSGEELNFFKVIRGKYPKSFRRMGTCRHFVSMSD